MEDKKLWYPMFVVPVVISIVTIGVVVGYVNWSKNEASVQANRTSQDGGGTTANSSEFELAKDKQKQIWDSEHIAFEIEKRFGKRCLATIQQRSTPGFTELCRPGFSGSVPSLKQGVERSHADMAEVHFTQSNVDSIDATQIAQFLASELSEFETVTATKLRALNVERLENDNWTTRLLLSFAGMDSEGSGIEWTSTQTVEFSFAKDVDLETKPVLSSWRIESMTRRKSPRPFFVEATTSVGLDQTEIKDNWLLDKNQVRQYRFQFAVVDFDGDGWLDIAVAERDRSSLLRFSPTDGKFIDVAREMGIHVNHLPYGKPTKLAAWFDFDNDGFPDLLLGNRLYRNEKGLRFTDVTAQSGLRLKPQAMGAHVVDYDCDGLLDLYILYQASEESPPPKRKLSWVNDEYGERNRLWRNLGDGRFSDVTLKSQTGGGYRSTLAATWFFADDDRYPDLYIANDFSENVLLRNNGDGSFTDISKGSRAADFATTMGVAAGDTNNDGKSDLYVANMYSKMGRRIMRHVSKADYPADIFEQIQGSCAGNRLYLKNTDAEDYRDVGDEYGVQGVGWAYAPAMVDFDNDGWLDLYATTGFLSFRRDKADG